jgi:type IV pilus assembly protein PilB
MALFRSKTATLEPGEDAGERRLAAPDAELTRIGQLLLQRAAITTLQLDAALTEASGATAPFVDHLLADGVDRFTVLRAVGEVHGVESSEGVALQPNPAVLGALDELTVRRHQAIPLDDTDGRLLMLTSEPKMANRTAVEQVLARPVRWLVAESLTVRTLIDRTYRSDEQIERLVKAFESTNEQRAAVVAARDAADDLADENAPVVQVVNRIVTQALRDRTSDVHIEALDDKVRVRFRIDGALVDAFTLPLGIHLALVSRLKILAGMNIVERRRPQDGQFSLNVDSRDVDVRVSSVSTVFGEKVVLRLLDKGRSLIGLSQLGFPRDTYEDYSAMVHSPFGMVLCAGPTGAGKTTTLYATLGEINSVGKNVTTIEDPVEYVFPGINQIQANEAAGLTFATGLRAILRQDPDVILVGEIRDVDTARIAIQSALTGHFVLSSVHGTDAVAALHRFLDMGIESFLIASSVIGVVGQRLLRRICDNCREPYLPPPQEVGFYERNGGYPKTEFFHGRGCELCAGTGYRDRIGIYELLRITPELRRLVVGWATQDELRKMAVAQGMRTLAMEALSLVDQDITTIPEVVRTLFGN